MAKFVSMKPIIRFLPRIISVITIYAIIFASSTAASAAQSSPVATPLSASAPLGLDGRNIALWQSHGLYYNDEKDAWLWQRAHLLQTIEDLYSASYVIDLLAPMLENAGAYVMLPRERDLNAEEVIVDASSPLTPGYREQQGANRWSDVDSVGFVMMTRLQGYDNPFTGSARTVKAVTRASDQSTASWSADIPRQSTYSIYISYPPGDNASAVTYRVNSMRGTEAYTVNQTMGAGTWIRLGEFPLAAGRSDRPIVEVTNLVGKADADKMVGADAVRIGGGMGNVVRGDSVSGKPRWMEGARYWLQFAGMPPEVYASSETVKDYADDFRSRPNWVNYLAGGSRRIPNAKGLNIPIDLSLALHTDAGTTNDSTTVGTLGIYSTDDGNLLGDGRRRSACRELTEAVVTSVVNDLRKLHNPNWTMRKLRDRKYAEARIPQVPATLIELLSHQNIADMRYGQDPQFRFDAARAIYKGVLRYLAAADRRSYVVQPLPASNFAIHSNGSGCYTLSWSATDDPLEPTATPTTYIIERRLDDGAFIPYRTVTDTSIEYHAEPNRLTSFRIIAANDGGRAFPSEVLALCYKPGRNPEVLIVNGFTRVGAPQWFDDDGQAGFLNEVDYGVPYVRNIAYSGQQYNFDRSSKWVDDVIDPGFGASHSDYDGTPIAGNTFDFVAVHGKAIANAGFSFCSSSLSAYCNDSIATQPIVDLILGKQMQTAAATDTDEGRFKTFPAALQQRLTDHINRHGNLFISGAYVASDLLSNPYSNDSIAEIDARFANDVLGIDIESAFAASTGNVRIHPFWANEFGSCQIAFADRPNSDTYVVESPDAISSSGRGKAITIMEYAESGKSAAIGWYDDTNAVIVAGFPFEAISCQAARNRLMSIVMQFITTIKQPYAGDGASTIKWHRTNPSLPLKDSIQPDI
jgi:hypothetical protein